MLGEQAALSLDMSRCFVWTLSSPRGSFEADDKCMCSNEQPEVIGTCDSPSVGAMLVEADVVKEVCNSRCGSTASFGGV
jgi:hypothetical protein